MLRELGAIDFVIKILYEMFVQGLLRQEALSESLQADIDNLIDAVSSFLLMVTQRSYENALYVVQWYYLFKEVLCEGCELREPLRLDALLVQVFQQTDINTTF